jgi:hypothetical protein
MMGFVAGLICNSTKDRPYPENQSGPRYTIILFASSALTGALCSLFIKEDLRRLRPQEEAPSSIVEPPDEIAEENPSGNYLPKMQQNRFDYKKTGDDSDF